MKGLLIVFLALFFWQCTKTDKEQSVPTIHWDMQRLDRTLAEAKSAEAIDSSDLAGQANSGFARIKQEIVDFAGQSQGQAVYFELKRTD